jgi:hypothetical protein
LDGFDIFKTGGRDSVQVIRDIIEASRMVWPNMTWECPCCDWTKRAELFIYKTHSWAEDWDKNGATVDNLGTLISVVVIGDRFTVISDEDITGETDFDRILSELENQYEYD